MSARARREAAKEDEDDEDEDEDEVGEPNLAVPSTDSCIGRNEQNETGEQVEDRQPLQTK